MNHQVISDKIIVWRCAREQCQYWTNIMNISSLGTIWLLVMMWRCASSQHFKGKLNETKEVLKAGWICTTWLGWLQTRKGEVCSLHFLIKCFEQRSFIPTWISVTCWESSFGFANDLMLLVRFSLVCELFTLCITESLFRNPNVVWNTPMNLSNMQKQNNKSRNSRYIDLSK